MDPRPGASPPAFEARSVAAFGPTRSRLGWPRSRRSDRRDRYPSRRDPAPGGVLHGLYWLTANLAESEPLLVAVDDAHWADEPSLRFLAYLVRRAESLPLALVICTRADEAPATAGALDEIRTEPATDVVRPKPLGVAAVEALLRSAAGGPVGEAFARACHDATGGNPFLLAELARELSELFSRAGYRAGSVGETQGAVRIVEAMAV